jgi:hypothetical protein
LAIGCWLLAIGCWLLSIVYWLLAVAYVGLRKDCGTGHCLHGRRKSRCKDCGTGRCVHRRRKGSCKDSAEPPAPRQLRRTTCCLLSICVLATRWFCGAVSEQRAARCIAATGALLEKSFRETWSHCTHAHAWKCQAAKPMRELQNLLPRADHTEAYA